MSQQSRKHMRFGIAIAVILVALGYIAYAGFQEGKSYYVTIQELHAQNNKKFYGKHLRLVGNVQPGSIRQVGTSADFVLEDKGETQKVSYKGSEPPPDTFKDNAQALAIGEFRPDGTFYAREVQAKCASKYATPEQQQQSMPAQPQSKGY
jgi:cytochrome c-type biogenesis protein CcmE